MLRLEKRDYNVIDALEGDVIIIEELEQMMVDGNGGYICDDISEIGDNNVEIYNSNLWQIAPRIEEYIEEAIMNFGIDEKNFDLIKLFQQGHYMYNTQLLYNNLEDIIYNAIANVVEEKLNESDSIDVDDLDIGDVEDRIDSLASDLNDNNNHTSSIRDEAIDLVNELIDELIEQQEENEEEE